MGWPRDVTIEYLRQSTRYSQWANALLRDALAELPAEELALVRSDGAGSILKVLNHMRVVDRIWRAHLEGTSHGFTARNTPVLPAFEELMREQAALDAWYVDYSDRVSHAQAGEVVRFKFVDGGEGAMTRGEMILHVVNHKT